MLWINRLVVWERIWHHISEYKCWDEMHAQMKATQQYLFLICCLHVAAAFSFYMLRFGGVMIMLRLLLLFLFFHLVDVCVCLWRGFGVFFFETSVQNAAYAKKHLKSVNFCQHWASLQLALVPKSFIPITYLSTWADLTYSSDLESSLLLLVS